jgi:uncharacterized membrane protein YphA (DoxX/SURF4 family)
MKKSISILFITLRLVLGGMMLYGGISKFTKPAPSPDTMLIMEESEKTELLQNQEGLKIKNYIFGMKQSGFAWHIVGVAEILGGILLISQLFSLVGALIVLPVTLHIFLFHLLLEPDEKGELGLALLYFLINLLLIFKEYKLVKQLLKIKYW